MVIINNKKLFLNSEITLKIVGSGEQKIISRIACPNEII